MLRKYFDFGEYDYVGYGIINVKTSGKAEGKFGISEISFGNYKTGLLMNWAKKNEAKIEAQGCDHGPNPFLLMSCARHMTPN